ncbi:MAG: hypothetical protein P8Y42_18650, partial [Exilibacterium sp.]
DGYKKNTAAYKNTNLPHCDLVYTGTSFSCYSNEPYDPVYVPKSTYESEINLPNNACTVSFRDGTSWDRQFGCFVASYWLSSLPSAYFDTTIFDGASPFSATIGSWSPEAITEGVEYYTYIEFWAYKNESWLGQEAYLTGQIGSSERTAYGSPFSVDTSRKLREYIGIEIPTL